VEYVKISFKYFHGGALKIRKISYELSEYGETAVTTREIPRFNLQGIYSLLSPMKHDFFNAYCHAYVCDYRRGFGLDIGFIDHFNTLNKSPQHPLSLFQSAASSPALY
jgi:hypothetical protein